MWFRLPETLVIEHGFNRVSDVQPQSPSDEVLTRVAAAVLVLRHQLGAADPG